MSVTNGQIANQTTFNNAFMSRTVDTSTVGKVDLNNAAAVSGTAIVNVQRELNSLASFLGKALNIAKDALPTWTEDEIGAAGDDVFERVDALSSYAVVRAGIVPLTQDVDSIDVAFSSDWVDTNYVIDFCFESTDATPIFLQGIPHNRTVSGFSVKFNAPPDTGNYSLNYSIRKAV